MCAGMPGSACSGLSARRGLAIKIVQRLDHGPRFVAPEAVIDGLGVASCLDEPVMAQPSQMLRQGRLAQIDHLFHLADRKLALGEGTENEKATFVAHRFEQCAGLPGIGLEVGGVHAPEFTGATVAVKQLLAAGYLEAGAGGPEPGSDWRDGPFRVRFARCNDGGRTMTEQVVRLDARDLICPIPVLKARKALNALPAGAILEVLATDPAAPKDFEAFCQATGNALLSTGEVDGATLFRIEKSS